MASAMVTMIKTKNVPTPVQASECENPTQIDMAAAIMTSHPPNFWLEYSPSLIMADPSEQVVL
jgi:hypothetical protein